MISLFLWNVINLFDGEARWFLTFLLILALAATTTHIWRWLSARLSKKFKENGAYIKEGAITAALTPVSFYIWFLTAIQCIDLISDRFFSESLSDWVKIVYGVSGVLTLGWFLIGLQKNVTSSLIQKSRNGEIALDPGKVVGIAKLAFAFIIVLIILLLMEAIGVSVATLLAFGGISGLALAFASQEIISNFFGGMMILIIQPFSAGDRIKLPGSDIDGYVEEIGWYETRLRSLDKQPIYVPNSLFPKGYVINSSRRTHRAIEEKLSLRHVDLSKAELILNDIRSFLKSCKEIDPKQKVLVNIEVIASGTVDFRMRALSHVIEEVQFMHFRDEVILHVAEIIARHDAELALPVQVVLNVDKNDDKKKAR